MTGNFYLGDVVTKGAYTSIDPIFMPLVDRSISIRPSEPEQKDFKYYMDILYYNRVNSLGDILTSIVYVGNLRGSTPNNTFKYDPTLMFRQTLAEQYIGVKEEDANFFGFNYIKEHSTLPLYSNPVDYETFIRNGKLSNTLGPINIAFDGWYTLITVTITDRGFYGIEGELTWSDPNNYVPYQINGSGESIELLDIKNFTNETLALGQLPYNTTIYNTYKKVDFFVLYDFKELYKKELELETALDYRASYNSIIEKGKLLEYLLEAGEFSTAQQLLQSVEDSILLNVLV